MIDFIKLVVAALLGALGALFLLGLVGVLALLLTVERPPRVPADAVLQLDLSRPVGDGQPPLDILGLLEPGAGLHPLRLDQIVRALVHAARMTDEAREQLADLLQRQRQSFHDTIAAARPVERGPTCSRSRRARRSSTPARPWTWG